MRNNPQNVIVNSTRATWSLGKAEIINLLKTSDVPYQKVGMSFLYCIYIEQTTGYNVNIQTCVKCSFSRIFHYIPISYWLISSIDCFGFGFNLLHWASSSWRLNLIKKNNCIMNHVTRRQGRDGLYSFWLPKCDDIWRSDRGNQWSINGFISSLYPCVHWNWSLRHFQEDKCRDMNNAVLQYREKGQREWYGI